MQFYPCLSLFYLIPYHITTPLCFTAALIFLIFNTQKYHLPTSERKDALRIKLITSICTLKHLCFVPIGIKQAWTKFNLQQFLNRPAVVQENFHNVPASSYLIKVNKRSTRNLRRSDVFMFNSKHNSHHFRAFLLPNLNKKMFLGCVMLNKLLHRPFFKQ